MKNDTKMLKDAINRVRTYSKIILATPTDFEKFNYYLKVIENEYKKAISFYTKG